MELFRLDPVNLSKRNESLQIWFMGDVHRSSVACCEDRWQQDIEAVRRDPHARVVLMGDLFNGVWISHRHFEHQDLHRQFRTLSIDALLNLELDALTDELRPIQNKILFAIAGNHDERPRAAAGFDVHEELCKRLQIKNGGYEAMATIPVGLGDAKWKKDNRRTGRWQLSMFCHHGWFGGGRMPGSESNNLRRALAESDCDLIACGHSHRSGVQTARTLGISMRGPKPRILRRERLALSTGSYLERAVPGRVDTYAARKNFSALQIGGRVVHVRPRPRRIWTQIGVDMEDEDGAGPGPGEEKAASP